MWFPFLAQKRAIICLRTAALKLLFPCPLLLALFIPASVFIAHFYTFSISHEDSSYLEHKFQELGSELSYLYSTVPNGK